MAGAGAWGDGAVTVYMIRAGQSGPIKIGWALSPTQRLETLQTANHETLTIMRLFLGAEAEEMALHKRFSNLHIRGEWFRFATEMMGDVGLAETSLRECDRAQDPLFDQIPAGCKKSAWKAAVRVFQRRAKLLDEPLTPMEIYDRRMSDDIILIPGMALEP